MFPLLLTGVIGFPISKYVTYRLSKSKIKEDIVLKYIDESNEIYNEIDDLICFIVNNDNVNEMNRRLGHLKTKLRKLIATAELNNSILSLDSETLKELEDMLKLLSLGTPDNVAKLLSSAKEKFKKINNRMYSSIGFKRN